MKKYFFIALLALGLTSCTTTVRHVKDYDKIICSSKKAVLFPAEVIMHTSDVGGKKERIDNYEYFLEDIINEEAKKVLEQAGYTVKFASKRLMHESSTSRHFSILREEYDVHKKAMYKIIDVSAKEAEIIDKKLPTLANFTKNFPADIYVMVDYEGIIKTTGARVMDFATAALIPGARTDPAESFVMIVAIIDSHTGNLVWANAASDIRGHFSGMFVNNSNKDKYERQQIQKLLADALSKLALKK